MARLPEPVERVATEDEVRAEAYRRWEAAGRPHGDGIEFWLAAEQGLSAK